MNNIIMNPYIINSCILKFLRQFQPMLVLQIPFNNSNIFSSKGSKKIEQHIHDFL